MSSLAGEAGRASAHMSTRQAAEVLAFSRYHARHLARTGAIPATKQNGRWWLDEQAVRELAAGRTRWVSVAAGRRWWASRLEASKRQSAVARLRAAG